MTYNISKRRKFENYLGRAMEKNHILTEIESGDE